MRGQDLLREIEYIDNDLIEEARVIKKSKRNHTRIIGSIGSLAAILAISLIAYYMRDVSRLINRDMQTAETSSVMTTTTATVEESAEVVAEDSTRFGDTQPETATMDEVTVESAVVEMPALIRVNGKLYYDTAEYSTELRCGLMDGRITSMTEGIPEEDNQSNFGVDFDYQLAGDHIEVLIDNQWHIFRLYEEFEQ